MSEKTINTRIKQKRDSESNWQSKNPKLLYGEIVLVDMSDGELRAKIGDGIKTYNQLPFSDAILRNLISNVDSRISNVDSKVDDVDSKIESLVGNTEVSTQIENQIKAVVVFSTNNPKSNGTASPGKESTLSRSDHVHPTDMTRASKTEFDTHVTNFNNHVTSYNAHTSDTTKHITAAERTQWNNAQPNQKAFSNIAVSGQTTVAADTTTDTVTFVGNNVSITTDATNNKVTFSVADGSTSDKGVVKLINSTSSTSTETAATPNSVKSAYDLANTAKTNAATAQTKADSAYTLASAHDHFLGENPTITEDSTTQWKDLGTGYAYINKNSNDSYPMTWPLNVDGTLQAFGLLINLVHGGLVDQEWHVLNSNHRVFYRSGNASGWHSNGWVQTFNMNMELPVANLEALTSNRALISNGSGKVAASDVTSTELGYLDGVTSNIQTQLNGKAGSSHGTHVSYSTTAPVMDGTASVGSASTVARSDHKHPVDTSRASQSDFSTHASNTTHITSTERTNWNAAKTHADTAHNYAGSSTSGGAATSANKINTDAGSTTQPVYFSGGIPKATTYTLGKSVPSDAVFTDTKALSSMTGTLSIAHGGTDATTANGAAFNILGGISSTDTNSVADSTQVVFRLSDPSASNGVLYTKSASTISDYVRGKVTLSDLGITASASELNKMDGVTASTTELNYVDGVTSAIQTQIDGKQATISGAATTITSSNLTASRALVSNSSGKVAVSAVTSTELGYLDGVSSNIQTQIDAIMNLNELGTNIPSNSSLDDYTTPGVYVCKTSSISKTITNSPTTISGYKLVVMYSSAEDRPFQIAYCTNGNVYSRGYTSSGWQYWRSNGIEYGDTLPTSDIFNGRVFYKKVSS